MASRDVRWCTNWCTGACHAPHAPRSDEGSRALADAGSCPGNCAGMEEATGAPSSFTAYFRGGCGLPVATGVRSLTRPPSPLTMLFSRHTRRREFITLLGGAVVAWPVAARAQQTPPPPHGERGTFFVSAAGNDANDGRSEATPWKTIGKVNSSFWAPGDRIRFRAGDKFDGNVWLHPGNLPSRGDQNNRMIVETYFTVIGGPLAEINPTFGGETGMVHVDRVGGVTVQNLKLTAPDITKMPRGGVLINNNSAQRVGGITVQRCDISGIRHGEATGYFGGEVFVEGYPGTGGIENVLIQNNNLHGRDGPTSRDDLGTGGFGNGRNVFNMVHRGNLCYHIGGSSMLPTISPTQQGYPPMGDGLDFNGVQGGLSEFNIIHDNAWNYTNPGGGPCAILTANAANITVQFNEGYNIQPANPIQAADFVGLDLDNSTEKSVAQFNYMHDNYNSGIMLFSNGAADWNNNTLRKNLCVNNCKSGQYGFGEITIGIPGGNPTIQVDDNVTYNDRIYHGQPYQNLDQGSPGISMNAEGTFGGTIQRNTNIMSQDIYGLWSPLNARKNTSGWNPAVTISDNQWLGRNGGFALWWGQMMYNDLGSWQAASGRGPNIAVAGAGPNVFVTYQLALSSADRTVAANALAAITTISGIDIVEPRASALRTRLLAGDSPVTLPEFIALGFALTRMDTAASNALLVRIKAIVLAV
jgi:hypothetical protein